MVLWMNWTGLYMCQYWHNWHHAQIMSDMGRSAVSTVQCVPTPKVDTRTALLAYCVQSTKLSARCENMSHRRVFYQSSSYRHHATYRHSSVGTVRSVQHAVNTGLLSAGTAFQVSTPIHGRLPSRIHADGSHTDENHGANCSRVHAHGRLPPR